MPSGWLCEPCRVSAGRAGGPNSGSRNDATLKVYIYYIFLRGILGCRMDASCQRIWPTKGESQSRGIVAFPAIFMDAIKYGDPHGTFMPFRSAECEEESKTLFSLAQVLHY